MSKGGSHYTITVLAGFHPQFSKYDLQSVTSRKALFPVKSFDKKKSQNRG